VRLLISRACIIGLNFVLLAGAIYFGARSANDLLVMWWTAPPASPVRRAVAARPPRHLVRASYEPIVERDVFNAVKQSAPEEPVVESIDLHLKLIGTSHLGMAESFAIIEDSRNNLQSLYKLGTDVMDAGRLVTIEKERVIIDHGGRLVALEIPKTLSTASASPPPLPDEAERMDKAEAFAKEQEKIIQQHKLHPRRSHPLGDDEDQRRSQKLAEKLARRKNRGARRAARGDDDSSGEPAPAVNQLFQSKGAAPSAGSDD